MARVRRRLPFHTWTILAFLLILFLTCILYHYKIVFSNNHQKIIIFRDKFKVEEFCSVTILLWTKYYGKPFPDNEFYQDLFQRDCPSCLENCQVQVTSNRSLLNESDAVIFYGEDLNASDLPNFRLTNQIWIFHQLESPVYTTTKLYKFLGIFNWTMTYRRDSDIWCPYGRASKLKLKNIDDTKKITELAVNRTKLVAWVVSHCRTQSRRETYVRELRKHVPIDIFGKCGKICPILVSHSGDHNNSKEVIDPCFNFLSQQYKFYLSFENSLCVDYITEKFFNPLNFHMMPIVYGGSGNGNDYEKFAPPGSFIDTRNFSTPKQLAEYLIYLDGNTEEYLKYFRWKTDNNNKKCSVSDEADDHHHHDSKNNKTKKILQFDCWCALCHKLRSHKNNPKYQSYQSISKWWSFVPFHENDKTIKTENDEKFMEEKGLKRNARKIGTHSDSNMKPACESSLNRIGYL